MNTLSIDTLSWLQSWCANQKNDKRIDGKKIEIKTLDNPGWILNINLKNYLLENQEVEIIENENSENDWIFHWVRDGFFGAAGGPKNLSGMLNVFRHWIETGNIQDLNQDKKYKNSDVLEWLQSWYVSQCDGFWEHAYGMRINTPNETEWYVRIALSDTFWAGKEVLPSKKEISPGNWIHYKVHENNFEATGGIRNLVDILNLFKKWITTNVM